ncbi:MAG: signal peptidase II [Cellulomonadaceae bacterium]
MSDETAPLSPSARRPRPAYLTATIAVITVVVIGVDQLTKYVAEQRLEPGAPTQWFLGELLGWKLIYNPGAALSLGANVTWLLTIVAVAVVVAVARFSRRIESAGWAIAFGLVLGGALGNLIDRFAREPGFATGHVVDFINYAGFFIGNVADVAIVAAAVLIGILSVRGVPITGVPADDDAAPADDDAAPADGDAAPGERG